MHGENLKFPKDPPPGPDPGTSPGPQIDPIDFSSRARPERRRRSSWLLWAGWIGFVGCLASLMIAAWFVFAARQVSINIVPEPEQITLSGGWLSLKLGDNYLLSPGDHVLKAVKPGYHLLTHRIFVAAEKSLTLNLTMKKLPGRLSLGVYRDGNPESAVAGAQVFIDEKPVGPAPLESMAVPAGPREVVIRAARYQEFKTVIDMEGMEILQTFSFALVPGWADVVITSVPEGAHVSVDGEKRGQSPVTLALQPGTRQVVLSAPGFKSWEKKLTVEANQRRVLDQIRLEPADGKLAVKTQPPGAGVTVGQTYVGQTPATIPLAPGKKRVVRISKAGFETVERDVTVAPGAVTHLDLRLVPVQGVVRFTVEPADAQLLVNGQASGRVPGELRLPAAEHRLEIRKQGYQSFATVITPRPGYAQQIRVALKKSDPPAPQLPAVLSAHNGYQLRLIRPQAFTMGSSRREQGRRSNETLRKILLKRPFYIGAKEVTNGEFRQFLDTHSSGIVQQLSLNGANHPVVAVTWQQAAAFCNWLSAKESLKAAYVDKGGVLAAVDPIGPGYRLPSEAEWAYCARFKGEGAGLKYPWGKSFPPKSVVVNIADRSARNLLSLYLDSYDDGYPVSAPAGSFPANGLGLFDLGGNVAEWCHDFYHIYPYAGARVYTDPWGPAQGKHHVVRGASWKHATISVLRLAYRDYSSDKRHDLGFRVCRYADDLEDQ